MYIVFYILDILNVIPTMSRTVHILWIVASLSQSVRCNFT